MVRNFDVINQDFSMYSKNFSIEYNENPALFGCLMDSVNRKDGIGNTLNDTMQNLFNDHAAGILIAEGKSYGVIYHEEKYYFTDSHSCGIKGAPAKNSNGKACIVECDTINELTRICKRATGSRRVQYTLDHIDVQFNHNPIQDLHIVEPLSLKEPTPLNVEQQPQTVDIEVQTSVMAPIDCVQPIVDNELEVSDNIHEIRRKTRDNIVKQNTNIEQKSLPGIFSFHTGSTDGASNERSKSLHLIITSKEFWAVTYAFSVMIIYFTHCQCLNTKE